MAANRKRLGKLLNNLHLIPAPGPPPLDPVLLYEDPLRATDPIISIHRDIDAPRLFFPQFLKD